MIPISVAALLVRENRILLGKRRAGAMVGRWELPGGKCELGESPEEALHRELLEELRVDVKVGNHYVTVPFFHRGRERELRVFRVHETAPGWEAPENLPEHTKTGWFTSEELEKMHAVLVDSDREALTRVMESKLLFRSV